LSIYNKSKKSSKLGDVVRALIHAKKCVYSSLKKTYRPLLVFILPVYQFYRPGSCEVSNNIQC
jgi:hypothetical protein